MLDLVDSFSDKWLAFLWEQTVPHYWLTCFSILTKMSFWINSSRKAKESLLEGSIYHIVILMTLSLLIIKDLRSSFLIFTPKDSQFLKPQNLLQLLLISICFSHEIEATISQPNYMTNMMRLTSTLLTFPSCQAIFHQHQPMLSMHLSSFAMPVVAQVILIF